MFVYLLTEGANYQVNTYGGTDIFRIRQVDFSSLKIKLPPLTLSKGYRNDLKNYLGYGYVIITDWKILV